MNKKLEQPSFTDRQVNFARYGQVPDKQTWIFAADALFIFMQDSAIEALHTKRKRTQ